MQQPHQRAQPRPAGQDGRKHSTLVANSAPFTTPEASDEALGDLLLEVLPGDGRTIGNQAAQIGRAHV